MQLLAVDAIEPGMRLGRSVYRSDGLLLLARGMALRAEHIASLRRQRIGLVYISDGSLDVEIPEVVRTEVRTEAQKTIHRVLSDAPRPTRLQTGAVMKVVKDVIEEVLRNRNAVLALLDARGIETELMQHSVGVTVLSAFLGAHLGLPRASMLELGLGCMLHDVGKVMIPPAILYKPGPLSAEEFAIVQAHPEHGFQMLRQLREVPLLSAHVAYQHHERLDGSGYPRGLRQGQIHIFSVICAVADVFDAMTAARTYRGPVHPAVALEWIRSHAGTLFEHQIVSGLARIVAPYPIATRVLLNTGQVGLVTALTARALERPRVLLIRDREGNPYPNRQILDLSLHPEIQIVGPEGFPGDDPV